MKRTKIVATVSTGILCLALLIVGVWAAVVANFSINTKLTFNPNGVYVELSGQIYRGASYSELEPLLDDPSYTLEPCKNYTTEEAADGTSTSTTYSISSWNPAEVLFLPTEKVIQFKLNVTNKGDKQISVVPKNDVTIEGVTAREDISAVLAIPAGKMREYSITLTAGTTELKSVPFELNLDIVNTEDIENPTSDFTMNSSTTTQIDSINTGYSNSAYGQRVVVIPTSLGAKSINSGQIYNPAFQNITTSTKYLILPEGLETLGSCAVINRKGIVGVGLPNSLVRIEFEAFSGCTSLTSIAIPESLESIDMEKSYLGTNLSQAALVISVDEDNENFLISNGSLYDKNLTTLVWHKFQDEVNDIPSTIVEIGQGAFCGQDSLTSITIPSRVTSIGNWAFQNCTSLTSIEIPSSVTSIGYSAFNGCSSLTTVSIDNQSVVDTITSQSDSGSSYIISYATTIYIKSGLSTTSATYLTGNFTKQTSSDKAGYDKWVKNS